MGSTYREFYYIFYDEQDDVKADKTIMYKSM